LYLSKLPFPESGELNMSVEIKFLPDERSGLVATGSYLLDAAKRLGVKIPDECGGKGECDTCAVVVEQGATLLSSLTDSERVRLTPDRLAAGERLACQARIEFAGELVVRLAPATERAETSDETVRDLRKEFRDLPFQRKLSALVEFEAVTAFETLSAIADVPYKVAGKVMDLLAAKGRDMNSRERTVKRPPEHRTDNEGPIK
jgi:ferredoxin